MDLNMRLLLCLNRDFMSNLALNLLWPALEGHTFDLILSRAVAPSAPRAPEIEEWQRAEHRIVEGGLFAYLNARGTDCEFQSFEQRALASASGRLLEFANIDRADAISHVRSFDPHLIISIRFGQIFKTPLISLPRFGILNLHSGILPDHRGVLATFWAMLEGAEYIGCTLHRVTDNGIDTGPIVGIHRTAPDRARSLLWNVASLYDGGTEMIRDALEQLARGQPLAAKAQVAAQGRYYSWPMQEQVTQFRAAGYRLYSREDYSALFARYGVGEAEIAGILAVGGIL